MSGESIDDAWSESSEASQDDVRESRDKSRNGALALSDHNNGPIEPISRLSNECSRTLQTQQPPSAGEPERGRASAKRARHGGWDGGEGAADDGFGAYMRVKVQKLREQFDSDFADRDGPICAGTQRLFAGVTVWVDGATTPSREQIRELVGARGGRFETYFAPDCVTHVVCQTLAQATRLRLQKMVRAKRVSVVNPKWITDSIESEKLLPAAQYSVQGMTDASQRSIAAFFSTPKQSARNPP